MPKTTKKRAGRPEFAPTKAMRLMVSIAAGAGMAHEKIAIGLDISRPTLEKHFARELSIGAYERRIEVLTAMFLAARKGNVTAQKAYIAMDAPVLTAPPLKEAEPKVGKKEQAQADATTAAAGTEWHDDLPRHTGTRH